MREGRREGGTKRECNSINKSIEEMSSEFKYTYIYILHTLVEKYD